MEAEEPVSFAVAQQHHGERLDVYLSSLGAYSRAQWQQWIRQGHVTIAGQQVKPSHRLTTGEMLEVSLPAPQEVEIQPEHIPLDIVYEDADLLVVNKPRGMVVHPAIGHWTGTLVHALLYHCRDLQSINGTIRPGIVHRIDKDTSGLLVVAKSALALEQLSAQAQAHTMERHYVAVVCGQLPHARGVIDAPIGRDPKHRQRFAVTQATGARHAVTHFTRKERFAHHTVVALRLETGRTHQIRVHMHYIGHPIVGDPLYGGGRTAMDVPGQALHAQTLNFTHPRTQHVMQFHAPLPAEMTRLLDTLHAEKWV